MEENKKGNLGCFIIVFIIIASGIPLALKNKENVELFGMIPIIIIGLIIAYYIAKAMSDG